MTKQRKSDYQLVTFLIFILFPLLTFSCLPCPTFTQPSYTAYVYENATIGTSVLTAVAFNAYNDPINYGTLYLGTNLPFEIETSTGIIKVISQLDYNANNEYEVIIQATVSGYGYMKSVVATIYVLDSPDFIGPSVTCSISNVLVVVYENTVAPYNSTEWINCTIPDTAFLYHTDGSSPVSIDSYGFVTIDQVLDFENQSLYDIPVTFTDASNISINGDPLNITLRVLPVNEYAPIFLGNNYTFTILESTKVGSNIGHVSAIDYDKGLDGEFVFSIESNDYIAISQSGQLYAMNEFDYEELNSFELAVTVSDTPWNVNTSLTSTAMIYVHITNENDNPPDCPSVSTVEIPISSGASSIPIATLSCTDKDNDQLMYFIQDSNSESLALKTEHNVTILILNSIVTNEYTIWIIVSATDGFFVSSFYIFARFVLLDVSPSFTSSIYNCTVQETVPIGDVICKVHANGSDYIHYTLMSNEYNFVILSRSGEIVLFQLLDYESVTNYSITVRCENPFNPMLANTAIVNILVENSNDNRPTMEEIMFSKVTENAPDGTTVTKIQCTDNDTNSITKVFITEVSQLFQNGSLIGMENYPFNLSQVTGNVTVTGNIDFETISSYLMTVKCTDNGIPSLTSTGIVVIDVTEVNEFIPTFNTTQYTISVSEDTSPGTVLITLVAQDSDRGHDGELVYSLMPPQESFRINPRTGDVYLLRDLDRETINNYTLLAIVNDNPFNTSSSNKATATLKILVSDVNDNQPKCSNDVYRKSLSPSTIAGTSIVKLDCNDTDFKENGTLTYSLLNEQTMFDIDHLSGEIVLTKPITSSMSLYHTVLAVVQDQGNITRLNTTVYIEIELNLTEESVGQAIENEIKEESQQNIVTVTVSNVKLDSWGSAVQELVKTTVANSTTTYCILYPFNCSLLPLCVNLSGSWSNGCVQYLSFKSSDVVINQTPFESTNGNLTELHIAMFVKLPHNALKSPFRQTNYVVPQESLKIIIQDNKDIIGALIRDTVSNITILYSLIWKELAISLLVTFAIIFSMVTIAVLTTYAYKNYKKKPRRFKFKTTPMEAQVHRDPSVITKTKLASPTTTTRSNPSSAKSSSDGCSLINVSEGSSQVGSNSGRSSSYGNNSNNDNSTLILNKLNSIISSKKDKDNDIESDRFHHPFAVESTL